MMNAHRIAIVALSASLAGCVGAQAPNAGAPTPGASAPASPPASPATGGEAAAGFQITGHVQDEELGALEGVTVTANTATGVAGTATTGADGRYRLSLAPGGYEVRATKPGFTERAQAFTVAGATTVNFGGLEAAGANPYFLSTTPEIARVEVKEEAPGGPLTLALHLSEPVTKASQENFTSRFEVLAGASEPFLRAAVAPVTALRSEATWDASGRVFTFRYTEPYLAGATYTARLRQIPLDKIDPVTRETAWEDLRITDEAGHPLGKNRADFAFLRQPLELIHFRDLANKDLGHTDAIRRWNLTHRPNHQFVSAQDVSAPGLVSVRGNTEQRIGDKVQDVLELRFTEPMRVVKDRDQTTYTLLDRAKQLVTLNVSASPDGAAPEPFNAVVSEVAFSRSEPKLVYLYFPAGTFKDLDWVEVTLGVDARDPAGNKPDPQKSRVSGAIG